MPNIVLSGGEPLIHYEFEKILQNLNGFATTGIVTSLYGCGTDIIKNLDIFSDIQVSIYGWDEKSHDEFTNSKGSFQEVWSNIKLIVKSGRNVTITSMNNDIRKIERIVNLCINAGVKKLQFGEIVQMGRAKLNSDKISEYALSKRIILNLQEKYHDEIEILYDEGCFSNANFSYCGAGTYKIDIDEGGNAFPCIFASRLSFSNIIKDKDIFENKVKINSSFLDYTNITCSALKNICNIY